MVHDICIKFCIDTNYQANKHNLRVTIAQNNKHSTESLHRISTHSNKKLTLKKHHFCFFSFFCSLICQYQLLL